MLNIEQISSIPDSVQNVGIIPLSKWNQYYAYPKVGTLRQMIFHQKYGIEKVVIRIGGRVYLKVADFFKWLKEQDKTSIV